MKNDWIPRVETDVFGGLTSASQISEAESTTPALFGSQPGPLVSDNCDYLIEQATPDETTQGLLSVIVPAYNAESTLGPCLAALRECPAITEIIVADDGSTDRSRDIANAYGARIISHDGPPRGPAFARNEGSKLANSRYLLFVDADVVLRPDAPDHLLAALQKGNAVAAIGSYDDTPSAKRLTSQYANLRHHFVHQRSAGEVSTFWSGIGMMERYAFDAAGGFEGERFPYPSVEDVALGLRLTRVGEKVLLVPAAQGTHLKDWTAWRVWHTDIMRRAVPWSEMIAAGEGPPRDLMMAPSEKCAALLAWMMPVAGVFAYINPQYLWVLGLNVALYLTCNIGFYKLLGKKVGPLGLITGVFMHLLYHLYASAVFTVVHSRIRLGLKPGKNWFPPQPAGPVLSVEQARTLLP